MSPIDPRTPCIIGVATQTWHPQSVGEHGAPEPLEMWEHVSRLAERDTGKSGLLAALDSLQIVYCQTWEYDDAVSRLAARLSAAPRHRHYSGIGGTTTQQLVNATSEAMLRGEMDLALITSAEALATKRLRKRDGGRYAASFRAADPFTVPVGIASRPGRNRPRGVPGVVDVRGVRLGPTCPPRHRARRLPRRMGELLAPMTQIAARNPAAWYRTERSAAEIINAGPDNRMVGYPYTKYMVAVMDVDMAGALVLATHARADEPRNTGRSAGLPARMVVSHGIQRSSPNIPTWRVHRRWPRRPPRRCGSPPCPSTTWPPSTSTHVSRAHCTSRATRSASASAIRAGVTVTGGLPYHGGPASGYLTHSIAAMVERLRAEPGTVGLVSGVGMHMTKHVFGVYGTSPGRGPDRPIPRPCRQPSIASDSIPVVAEHDGDATVSAYSVVHGRDGSPEWALLVCDLPSGARTYAQARARRVVRRRRDQRTRRPSRHVASKHRRRTRRDHPGECRHVVTRDPAKGTKDLLANATKRTAGRRDIGFAAYPAERAGTMNAARRVGPDRDVDSGQTSASATD